MIQYFVFIVGLSAIVCNINSMGGADITKEVRSIFFGYTSDTVNTSVKTIEDWADHCFQPLDDADKLKVLYVLELQCNLNQYLLDALVAEPIDGQRINRMALYCSTCLRLKKSVNNSDGWCNALSAFHDLAGNNQQWEYIVKLRYVDNQNTELYLNNLSKCRRLALSCSQQSALYQHPRFSDTLQGILVKPDGSQTLQDTAIRYLKTTDQCKNLAQQYCAPSVWGAFDNKKNEPVILHNINEELEVSRLLDRILIRK